MLLQQNICMFLLCIVLPIIYVGWVATNMVCFRRSFLRGRLDLSMSRIGPRLVWAFTYIQFWKRVMGKVLFSCTLQSFLVVKNIEKYI